MASPTSAAEWRCARPAVPDNRGMRIVRLGAVCDCLPEHEDQRRVPALDGVRAMPGRYADDPTAELRRVASFSVEQFADLDDGLRLVLDNSRSGPTGFGLGGSVAVSADPYALLTLEDLTRSVLTTVLPDEDDGEEHPWGWIADPLREHGVEVSEEKLKVVPYVVEFSDRLRARVPR